MKNLIANFSKTDKLFFKSIILTIIIFAIFSLSSCRTLKKTHESETIEKEFKDSKKDSTTTIIINNPIRDRIIQEAPISDNPELIRMFDEMMSKLNTSKQSGDNGYNSRYDKELRQWVIDFTVGQTKNKDVAVKEETKEEKTFEQNVNDYVKKTTFPWWIYVIAIVLAWPTISKVVSLIFPAYRATKLYTYFNPTRPT